MAAFIRIIRSGASGGLLRCVKVYIDGLYVGAISHGASEAFEVDPGQHTISASVDVFFGSQSCDISISHGQTLVYVCRERRMLEGSVLWFLQPKHYLILEPDK